MHDASILALQFNEETHLLQEQRGVQDALEIVLPHHQEMAICEASDGDFSWLPANQGELACHASRSQHGNLRSEVGPFHECALALEGAKAIPVNGAVRTLGIEPSLCLLARGLILVRNEELIRLNVLPSGTDEVRGDDMHTNLATHKNVAMLTRITLPEDDLLRRSIAEVGHLSNTLQRAPALFLYLLEELQRAQQSHWPKNVLEVLLLDDEEVAICDADYRATSWLPVEEGHLSQDITFTKASHVSTMVCPMSVETLPIEGLVRLHRRPLHFREGLELMHADELPLRDVLPGGHLVLGQHMHRDLSSRNDVCIRGDIPLATYHFTCQGANKGH
mmetsp:Transcript_15730/g.36921  ORF Transcript_15730/g.36921 Transcript_15730/m.36921 type:complete len:334 (+) Transcript_15730:1578-2579(+)